MPPTICNHHGPEYISMFDDRRSFIERCLYYAGRWRYLCLLCGETSVDGIKEWEKI